MGIRSSKEKKEIKVAPEPSTVTNKLKSVNLIKYKSPYNMIRAILDFVNTNIKHLIMNLLYKKAESIIDMNVPQNLSNWLYLLSEWHKRMTFTWNDSFILHMKRLSQINDRSGEHKNIKLKISGIIKKYTTKQTILYSLRISSNIAIGNLVKLGQEILRVNPTCKPFLKISLRVPDRSWIGIANGKDVPEDKYNKECTYTLLISNFRDDRLSFKVVECKDQSIVSG